MSISIQPSKPNQLFEVQFTSSTTWNVPSGVDSVEVLCVGGGGGGRLALHLADPSHRRQPPRDQGGRPGGDARRRGDRGARRRRVGHRAVPRVEETGQRLDRGAARALGEQRRAVPRRGLDSDRRRRLVWRAGDAARGGARRRRPRDRTGLTIHR